MNESEPNQRVTRPWIIAAIALLSVIAASLLGFRAFKVTANAETQASQQSAQSELAQSNDNQSASAQSDDASSSLKSTPVSVPKPTPPPHLYEGGQIGAQATSQWYIDLWAYAFNTGDTEDFMKVCQVAYYCDAFAHDLERMHADAHLIKPLTNKYLQTNAIYDCSLQKAGTQGICVEFTYLQTSAVFRHLTEEKASQEYDTISTSIDNESNTEQTVFRVLFLEEQGDGWIVTHIWSE